MIRLTRLVPIIIVLFAAGASAQTAGQVVDTELDFLRTEIADIRTLVETMDPSSPPDLTEIIARLDAAEAQAAAIEARLPAPCIECNDANIGNMAKTIASHYFRLMLVEYDIDPLGDLSACWDSGGYPDAETLECACPVTGERQSVWTPDSNPNDAVNDAACRYVDQGAALGTPNPEEAEEPATPDPMPEPTDTEPDQAESPSEPPPQEPP